jgi:hypothetical protein
LDFARQQEDNGIWDVIEHARGVIANPENVGLVLNTIK